MLLPLTCLLCLTLAVPLGAGKYNEVLSPGDPAPTWQDLPGVDGKKHALADLKDKRVVVVVFTCNSCPCAVDYEERLLAFCAKHAKEESSVGVVAINVNTVAADRMEAMKKRSELRKFPFAYLHDETQKIAKAYGAEYTPEFFVLDEHRRIAYQGAMDDKDPPGQAGKLYLEDAVTALLAGQKPAVAETLARGCKIRWNDKRRR